MADMQPTDDADLPPLAPGYFYVPPPPAPVASAFIAEESNRHDAYHYRILGLVAAKRTAFQNVVIADTRNYGRALFLDGAIQSAEDDEALYHEMMVQPAMLFHDAPRDVLIIGGGEGASLREALYHHTVRRVTMVDLDADVVDLCRAHLPSWHRGAFEDSRTDLRIGDGRRFIEESDDLFDVIIVDVVDMLDNGPAQALYTRQFYEAARHRLRPGGIMAIQALEFSHLDYKGHAAMARTLRTIFPEVHSYRAGIPSFLSNWGFLIASDHVDPTAIDAATIDRTIERRLGGACVDHLDGAFLTSAFSLCRATRQMLSFPGPRLEDGVAFVPPPNVDYDEPPLAQFPAIQP